MLIPLQDLLHIDGGVMDQSKQLLVNIAQLLAPQTDGVPVDHVGGGEVGQHPAVAQHGSDQQDGVSAQRPADEAVAFEPPQTDGVPVDHVGGGEVGQHPAVAQHGSDQQDGVSAQRPADEAVAFEPSSEVIQGIFESFPLPVGHDSAVAAVETAQPLSGFGIVCHITSPPNASPDGAP